MPQHARLNSSASYRWLNCPPSVLLSEKVPDQTSPYAEHDRSMREVYGLDKTLRE